MESTSQTDTILLIKFSFIVFVIIIIITEGSNKHNKESNFCRGFILLSHMQTYMYIAVFIFTGVKPPLSSLDRRTDFVVNL